MKKILILSAAGMAAAITLAGCSAGSDSGSGGGMPGMNHGSTGMSSSSAPVAAGDHNAADTMFTQGMIPHHTQAVEMSDLMLTKQGIDPKVAALATRIKAEQAPEITTMTGWLKSWNESAQMSAGHTMSGMMGADDMGKLQAAQGADAAKLFLTQMIAHHQGAIMMAKTEESDGKNTDAVALSKNIVISQQAEIQEMKDLLGTL